MYLYIIIQNIFISSYHNESHVTLEQISHHFLQLSVLLSLVRIQESA